jgi:polynucleotide 5'-hydroxyl-kinase GRC3/NOL9
MFTTKSEAMQHAHSPKRRKLVSDGRDAVTDKDDAADDDDEEDEDDDSYQQKRAGGRNKPSIAPSIKTIRSSVDVLLHPHQSIAIEGNCGVKVTSAVVCINGYLARCDHPEQYCRASALVGNAVTVRSGALGAEVRLTPLPMDDVIFFGSPSSAVLNGNDDCDCDDTNEDAVIKRREQPKEDEGAVIVARGHGFFAELFQRANKVSFRHHHQRQQQQPRIESLKREDDENNNYNNDNNSGGISNKKITRNISSFELVSFDRKATTGATNKGLPQVPDAIMLSISSAGGGSSSLMTAGTAATPINTIDTTNKANSTTTNRNGTLPRNKIAEDWARAGTAVGDMVRELSRDPKGVPAIVAFVGPKGVGKSTFARYVSNLLLIDYKKVGFLDIDPGQPERTAPGLVSVTTLQTPLIGPPALRLSGGEFLGSGEKPFHQKFVGDYSPESDVDAYVDACIECLEKWLKKMKDERATNRVEALLINCNGWVKGAGLEALAKFLNRIPNLTHVLNVQSHAEKRNCPGGAFWAVNNNADGDKRDIASFDGSMSFPDLEGTKITYVSAGAQGRNDNDENEGVIEACKRTPQDSRALLWLAWAKQAVARHAGRPECGGLRLTNEASAFAEISKGLEQATPWRVSLDDIKIKVLFSDIPNKNDALRVLNASVVGLLREDESCVGLAIVRSVNESENCVFLLSNVEESVISEVKTLCLGKVTLPMKLRGILNGSSPYAAIGVVANEGTGGAEQKSRNNIVRGSS